MGHLLKNANHHLVKTLNHHLVNKCETAPCTDCGEQTGRKVTWVSTGDFSGSGECLWGLCGLLSCFGWNPDSGICNWTWNSDAGIPPADQLSMAYNSNTKIWEASWWHAAGDLSAGNENITTIRCGLNGELYGSMVLQGMYENNSTVTITFADV